MLMHSSYCDLLMVLHSPFAYPWITNRFLRDSNESLRVEMVSQISKSTDTVVVAARNIIVMARTFDMNGANTHAYTLSPLINAWVLLTAS